MTTECVRCGRPTPDGFACVAETDRARQQLAEIADLVVAARAIAYGLSRSQSPVRGVGVPGSRVPLDLTATAKLDAIANALSGWVRIITDQRGLDYVVQLEGPKP